MPSPTHDPEIGEVGPREFIDATRWMLEAIPGRHHDVSGTGDQIAPLQNPLDAGFGDEVVLGIGDLPGQLPG